MPEATCRSQSALTHSLQLTGLTCVALLRKDICCEEQHRKCVHSKQMPPTIPFTDLTKMEGT